MASRLQQRWQTQKFVSVVVDCFIETMQRSLIMCDTHIILSRSGPHPSNMSNHILAMFFIVSSPYVIQWLVFEPFSPSCPVFFQNLKRP